MTVTAFAFGDPGTGIWGVAASSGGLAVATFAPELEIEDSADGSLLGYGGLQLRFTPTGSPAPFGPSLSGQMQLCAVQGAVHRDGTERDLSCLGMRATVEPEDGELGSIRAAAAWLDLEDGFALVALRPRGASGHSADRVSCALLEDGRPLEVEEPRFSTTYDGDGVPSRAGLEVWLAGAGADDEGGDPEPPHTGPGEDDTRGHSEQPDTDSEPLDTAPDPRYPRRAAGERTGDGAQLSLPGATARADLFTWHARGIHGAGVYLLIPAP
jgi:hypothetical protein